MDITHSDEAGYTFAFDADEACRLLLLGVAAHYGAIVTDRTVHRTLSMTPASSLMSGVPLLFKLGVKILPVSEAPLAPATPPIVTPEPDPTADPVPDAAAAGTDL